VRQGLFHLIHQDQTKVTRLKTVEGGIDGGELATDFADVVGAPRSGQPLAQEGEGFPRLAAAQAGILKEEDVVEGAADYFRLLPDVLVTPVTGHADDDAAPACGHGHHRLHQRLQGIGVVAVVGNDGGTAVVKDIETAGNGRRIGSEAGKARAG
jgi:hypothetical protein